MAAKFERSFSTTVSETFQVITSVRQLLCLISFSSCVIGSLPSLPACNLGCPRMPSPRSTGVAFEKKGAVCGRVPHLLFKLNPMTALVVNVPFTSGTSWTSNSRPTEFTMWKENNGNFCAFGFWAVLVFYFS